MMKKLLLSTMIIVLGLINTYGQTIDYNGTYHQVNTPSGFIRLGPYNTGWAHIYTDRPKFIFDKPVWVIGGILSSYTSDNIYLQTNGTTRMKILNSNGNIGIGISSPSYKLHASGDIYADGGWMRVSGDKGFYFQNHGGGFRMTDNTWIRTYGNKSFYHNTGTMRTDGTFQVGPGGNRFLVDGNGNVTMGTTTPASGYKLAVAGKIMAEEVTTQVQGMWPDYVFSKNYKLNSLEATESYIKEEGHLPNIPSASEVQESGINLGEMNAKLLEKIEELTLYLIDQNKKIEQQSVMMQVMQNEIELLKK